MRFTEHSRTSDWRPTAVLGATAGAVAWFLAAYLWYDDELRDAALGSVIFFLVYFVVQILLHHHYPKS